MKAKVSDRYRLLGGSREDELAALEADIRQRGILVPIEVDDEGNVLDGRARLQIARKLKIDCPRKIRRLRAEEDKVEHALKVQLLHREVGPISWARGFEKLLEIRGVERVRGPKPQVGGAISATVAGIAAELAVPERTARYRLQVAAELKDHPEVADQVDAGELTVREALLQAGRLKVTKPDLGNGISHPARYSAPLLEVFAQVLDGYRKVLDPFAGTGLIHQLEDHGHDTTGVEIEPEWAELHGRTIVGDARDLPFDDDSFHAICTSPTYGNRLADHHDATDPDRRRSYTHDLGHPLSKGNSGRLQWGPAFRDFHVEAWTEIVRVLRPRGLFVLNVKDHIRKLQRQYVSGWHVTALIDMGLTLLHHVEVDTAGLRTGSNVELRCPEYVYVLEKDAGT